MVRFTNVLCRIPVIKFRKGGLGQGPAPAASAPTAAAASPAQAAPQQTQAKPMSTQSIPDIDLPNRYKRRPLSEEEIAHEIHSIRKHASKPKAIAILKLPKGVLLQSGRNKEVVNLNITIGRGEDSKK